MGFRFRKSVKIAPGVKMNFSKSGVSTSFGGKGVHYSINSKGKRTSTVSVPGTGISYSSTNSSRKSKEKEFEEFVPIPDKEPASAPKKKGCLFYILAFFAVCLALIMYPFVWIPALFVLIYFIIRKDAGHKKRNIIVIILIIITSFLVFMGNSSSDSDVDLEQINVAWEETSFDINDTVTLEVTPVPADAEIHKLSIADNSIAAATYEDGKATITFTGTGTEDISFIADDKISSNSETVTVIDETAEEQKRLEEETAAQKAEEERIAAEQAAQAEQERIAAEQAAQEQQATQEEMVWIPANGQKYHSRSGCSNMNSPTQITLSEAQALGYAACKRCY